MTTIYRGTRTADGCDVAVIAADGMIRPLPLRLDLFRHSPTGFEWGYGGSGPAQLALALLAHALDDDARAVRLHQRFKRHYIAGMSREPGFTWELTRADVIRLADVVAEATP